MCIRDRLEYWLLDIDTTDSYYELLDGNGHMYFYDGGMLQSVTGIQECYYKEEEGVKDNHVRYLGKLGEFTRIDKRTISFEDYRSEWGGCAVASYRLDKHHNLCLQKRISEVKKIEQ